MKYRAGNTPPTWVRAIAHDRPRPLIASDALHAVPRIGDIVLKSFIDGRTYEQLFRVETWNTHDLLDGPFRSVREAMECAFEFGVTSRLTVWLDYSDDPDTHDLDSVPLYYADFSSGAESIA